MSEAARQGDPIAHTSALGGLLAGLAVGAGVALIGVAIAGTGGLAAVAIVGGAASLGAEIGQVVGGLSKFTRNTGHISSGSPNVYTNGQAAARASLSEVLCSNHGPHLVAEGSGNVYINGMPASRAGDHSTCGGKISAGSSNVFIGGETVATEEIAREVPRWLNNAIIALGIGSGVGLGLLRVVAWRTLGRGLAGGVVGGGIGDWTGGAVFGEGSDGQKLTALGGAVIGGWAAIRGVPWFNARYQIKVEGLGSNFGNIRIVRRDGNSFTGKLRGETYDLPGVKTEKMVYTKRDREEYSALQKDFKNSGRSNFLKDLSNTPEKMAALRKAGFSDLEIIKIQNGRLPNKGWQVHHIKPLDDGGTNSFDNLTLIKNEPYHKVITNTQKTLTNGMAPGSSKTLEWPMINSRIYPAHGG